MQRFIPQSDCYLDQKTNLEWSLNNLGEYLWKDTIKTCERLGKGWRLPTMQELMKLIDDSQVNPATELPDMVPSFYWSSTTYALDMDRAWLVYFDGGFDGWASKLRSHYVRAVRDKK